MNKFEMKKIEGRNQKKASKLNKIKLSNSVPLEDKKKYLDSFIFTVSMYNYYFFSDDKTTDAFNYINKTIKYNNSICVPYIICYDLKSKQYYLWGFYLNELEIIEVIEIKIKELNELTILNIDSFDFLFLNKGENL